MPSGTLTVLSERTTGLPIPPAPTSAAITTMESDSMMHWLTPAMMVGRAAGSFTLVSSCHRLQPNDSPASTRAFGTSEMPR